MMRDQVNEDCVMFINDNENFEMDEEFDSISPRFRPRAIDLICTTVNILPVNIFLAIVAITSLVGQNVVLPLWIDSSNAIDLENENLTFQSGIIDNNTHKLISQNVVIQTKFKTDSYFIVAITSYTMLAIFGLTLLIMYIFNPNYIGETEKRFPQKYMFGIGVCGGATSILLVYSSSGERTAPYLQAILGNFMIPMTLALRFFLLHKLPTSRKFISSMVVVLSLFICLTPTIFPQIDPAGNDLGGQPSGAGHILWPLCFMLGFIPVALINVVEEKALKIEDVNSSKQVNLFYFLFCCSLYEVATITLLFWTDMIPGFGNADGYSNFIAQWTYNFECFFGEGRCNSESLTLGILFLMSVLSANLSISFLLRYTEGALLVAIVCALVTPLSFIFWTLFQEVPFEWHPRVHITTWFSMGSLFLMCPGIYFYNTGEAEQTGMSDTEVVQLHEGFGNYEDRDPLVIDGTDHDSLENNQEIVTSEL